MSLRTDLERLDAACWSNAHVRIRPLATEADLIYAGYECKVSEEQKELVNPFWFSIGRAYLFREDHYPCIICNMQNEPVGFIDLNKRIGDDAYSWSFFIDEKQQGKGYGKQAARLAIQVLRRANPHMRIKLSTEVSNTVAQALYVSLGFEKSAEMDGDDIVFCM